MLLLLSFLIEQSAAPSSSLTSDEDSDGRTEDARIRPVIQGLPLKFLAGRADRGA